MVTPADNGNPKLTSCRSSAMASTPASVAAPSRIEAPQAIPRLWPLASMTEATVNPSGILWRKTARKMTHPSQLETIKPDAMAIPSKNRSEEHTSELQSPCNLVCRLLLEKKKKNEQRR